MFPEGAGPYVDLDEVRRRLRARALLPRPWPSTQRRRARAAGAGWRRSPRAWGSPVGRRAPCGSRARGRSGGCGGGRVAPVRVARGPVPQPQEAARRPCVCLGPSRARVIPGVGVLGSGATTARGVGPPFLSLQAQPGRPARLPPEIAAWRGLSAAVLSVADGGRGLGRSALGPWGRPLPPTAGVCHVHEGGGRPGRGGVPEREGLPWSLTPRALGGRGEGAQLEKVAGAPRRQPSRAARSGRPSAPPRRLSPQAVWNGWRASRRGETGSGSLQSVVVLESSGTGFGGKQESRRLEGLSEGRTWRWK